MAALVASLLSAAVPETVMVWASSGSLVALAFAVALTVSLVGIYCVRETPRRVQRIIPRLPGAHGHRLPSAA